MFAQRLFGNYTFLKHCFQFPNVCYKYATNWYWSKFSLEMKSKFNWFIPKNEILFRSCISNLINFIHNFSVVPRTAGNGAQAWKTKFTKNVVLHSTYNGNNVNSLANYINDLQSMYCNLNFLNWKLNHDWNYISWFIFNTSVVSKLKF